MINQENDRFSLALHANRSLLEQALSDFESSALSRGLMAHDEIERTPFETKCTVFYRHFFPLHKDLLELLANAYRRHFKLGLAHPSEVGPDPHDWVAIQLQVAITMALEWIRDWHILACDGENRRIQRIASIPFIPGETVSASIPTTVMLSSPKSWRAPSWLFHNYPTVGFALIRTAHVPPRDFEGRLGEAHTRLLLKWARQLFGRALQSWIENVWNEETAAAGTMPRQAVSTEERKAKLQPPKGFEGLSHKKADLSKYTDGLTEKQKLAFSLKYEYALPLSEVASRMGLDRKTVYEHLEAVERKLQQAYSNEKRNRKQGEHTPE